MMASNKSNLQLSVEQGFFKHVSRGGEASGHNLLSKNIYSDLSFWRYAIDSWKA